MNEQIKQIEKVLENLKNKNFNIYFFTLDTKGNPTAGIANIYEHVKKLNELGYNAKILHEKNDYKIVGDENSNGISDWLGSEYSKIPHVSLETGNLNITPEDFILIPEIFSNIMDQIKGFPCRKIVFSQSYDYIFELLPIGKRWDSDYGFKDVITTSVKQGEYLKGLFPNITYHVVPVSIPSYFKPSNKPKMPIVTILTRNQGDAAKIAKSFYLHNPLYKWVTFKELRGLSRKDFAEELGKSCLAIWIDESSGFGTFPLEAMECNTPIIGKIPNMVPEWMEKTDADGNMFIRENGIWTNTTLNISELIANYIKMWLEDSIPNELFEGIKESVGVYTDEKQMEKIKEVYENLINGRIAEIETTLTNENNKLLTNETNGK